MGHRATWPVEVRRLVDAAQKARTEPFDVTKDAELWQHLQGRRLHALHATRLMAEERYLVGAEGLRSPTQCLIDRKLDIAVQAGALTLTQAEKLRRGNALRTRRNEAREKSACLFVGSKSLSGDVSGLRNLLLMWGGEVINFTRAGQNLEDVVRRIGHPSMVSVALRLDRARDCSYFPSLMGLFLGRPSERGGTVYVPAPGVAAHEVIDVWYPGHPEYDKYPRLPRDRPVEAAC